jgi:adenylate cyclase
MRRPYDPVVRPDASRWAKFWGLLKRSWGPITAIAAFGAVLSGLVGYWHAYETVETVVASKPAKASAPAPPHFSVAILPFAARGGSPTDEQFAEALTNDLTAAVGSGNPGSVVSHSVATTYKGKAIDARAIGRELNVRYLVQGEVRRAAGERMIVNAQLVDTGNATQVWSDTLEADPTHTMQGSSALVSLLKVQVRRALAENEYRRASAPLSPGASAMDIALHAHAVYNQDPCDTVADCEKGMLQARKEFERALRLDPNLVKAMVFWADTLDDQLQLDLHADHDRLVRELDEMTNRAVTTDPNDPNAWFMRALALSWQWRWQAALEATTRMNNLVTASPWPFFQRARILLNTGRAEEALAWIDKALALDPRSLDQSLTRKALNVRCRAHQAIGRYDDAIADCEKSVALADYWNKHLYLVAAYAQKGETAKAEAEKKILLKQQPGMTITDLKAQRLSNDPVYLQQIETHLYAGLRKAGIPEK